MVIFALLVGLFVWVCVLKSGVHATLAGVVTALAVPFVGKKGSEEGPLLKLEHALGPWVSFAIVPLFAFANAGVSLHGMTLGELVTPIPLGIALGLFVGKAIGIYGFAKAAIGAGLGEMPRGATNAQLLGTAVLGGIGFTMSLFIGMLAFPGLPLSPVRIRCAEINGEGRLNSDGRLALRAAQDDPRHAAILLFWQTLSRLPGLSLASPAVVVRTSVTSRSETGLLTVIARRQR